LIEKSNEKIDEYIKKWKKYKVHDQANQAKEGDVVLIGETRPLSATKYFELIEIVKKQG
jgi:small subunit ribosomal protein S17